MNQVYRPVNNLRALKSPLETLIAKAEEKKRLAHMHTTLEDLLWDSQCLATSRFHSTDEVRAFLSRLQSVMTGIVPKDSKSIAKARATVNSIAELTRSDMDRIAASARF